MERVQSVVALLTASLRVTCRRNVYSTQPLIIKVLQRNTGDLFGTKTRSWFGSRRRPLFPADVVPRHRTSRPAETGGGRGRHRWVWRDRIRGGGPAGASRGRHLAHHRPRLCRAEQSATAIPVRRG